VSHDLQIVRLPDVIRRTGLGRSSIYAAIRRGEFPRPIKIGPRAVGFVSSQIDGWIEGRLADAALRSSK
jgi:prophage regulatory protein